MDSHFGAIKEGQAKPPELQSGEDRRTGKLLGTPSPEEDAKCEDDNGKLLN